MVDVNTYWAGKKKKVTRTDDVYDEEKDDKEEVDHNKMTSFMYTSIDSVSDSDSDYGSDDKYF